MSNQGMVKLISLWIVIVTLRPGSAQEDELTTAWLSRVEFGGNITLHCSAEKYPNQPLSWVEKNTTIVRRDNTGNISVFCHECKVQSPFNLILTNYTDSAKRSYDCVVHFDNKMTKVVDSYEVIMKVNMKITTTQQPKAVNFGGRMEWNINYSISYNQIRKIYMKEGGCEDRETIYTQETLCQQKGPGLCTISIPKVTRKEADRQHCLFIDFSHHHDAFRLPLPKINAGGAVGGLSPNPKINAGGAVGGLSPNPKINAASVVNSTTNSLKKNHSSSSAVQKTKSGPSQNPRNSSPQLIPNPQLITSILLLLGYWVLSRN